jgi:hypothetical protein
MENAPMRTFTLTIFFLASTLIGAGEADAAKAKTAELEFTALYDAGAAAAVEKKWSEAEKKFDAALKALGDNDHPKKAVAQVLLNKARDESKKQQAQAAALGTADELLRLKQWAEAEAAYRKAAESIGESEDVKKGIAAAQAGAAAEKAPPPAPAKTEAAVVPLPKVEAPPAKAELPPAKAEAPASKPETKTAAKEPEPLDLPNPIALDRDQWFKGAGSSCYWQGERLVLEEGDEYFKKTLSKDFAVTIQLEARMDHRSAIFIELRPTKESGTRQKITGWGSKEGSAPMLWVDKDIKARGDKRPPVEQITLSFVRTGRKVEFFCNGESVGHTWSERLDQPYTLWVGGKGIMDKAKLVER